MTEQKENAARSLFQMLAPDDFAYYLNTDAEKLDVLRQQGIASGLDVETIELFISQLNTFDPTYSNHRGIQEIVKNFSRTGGWVDQDFFERVFVGVTHSPIASASAVPGDSEDDGALCLYENGLMQAIIFASDTFSYFGQSLKGGSSSSKECNRYLHQVLDVFSQWRTNAANIDQQDTITFREKYSIGDDFATSIAGIADAFVVGHEMGHHLLGHTDLRFLDVKALEQIKLLAYNLDHLEDGIDEYLPDMIAFNLISDSPLNFRNMQPQSILSGLLGGAMALTTISLLMSDPYKSTPSHPPANYRFDNYLAYAEFHILPLSLNASVPREQILQVKRFRKEAQFFFDSLNRLRRERREY